jgi:hypothetical protein
MLLTWMAFRGKFPRAEPLHFLDEDLGPTTPPAEEFQPNVRVARDTTTTAKADMPLPGGVINKALSAQQSHRR